MLPAQPPRAHIHITTPKKPCLDPQCPHPTVLQGAHPAGTRSKAPALPGHPAPPPLPGTPGPHQVPQGAFLPPPQSPNTSQLGWGPWFVLVPPPSWLVLAVGRSLCVPRAVHTEAGAAQEAGFCPKSSCCSVGRGPWGSVGGRGGPGRGHGAAAGPALPLMSGNGAGAPRRDWGIVPISASPISL